METAKAVVSDGKGDERLAHKAAASCITIPQSSTAVIARSHHFLFAFIEYWLFGSEDLLWSTGTWSRH